MNDSVYTRQQRWGTFEEKEAEVGGGMPISSLPNAKPDPTAKHTIPKTGSAEELFATKIAAAEGPDDNLEAPVAGEQAPKNPQAQPISPRVDVSGKEPPKLITEKQAQYLAMPSIGRYPLDGLDQVKQAAAYFDEHQGSFSPRHSREFCSNLVKRASTLGVEVSDTVQKYGGAGYASAAELDIAMDSRCLVLDDDSQAVLGKLAEARVAMDPDDFAVALEEFDKLAGIDHLYGSDVLDPFLSTFGKTAAEGSEDGSHVIGNDIVTNNQLRELATTHCDDMKQHYGDDFVEEFKKDPVGIFKSLPVDQQKLISRQANEPVVDS